MDLATGVTLIVSILIALSGYLFTHFSNLRASQRSAKLERVNKQLTELYGPLFALVHVSDMAWRSFRFDYRPSGIFWGDDANPPTPEEATAWRTWMTSVFTPINRKLLELVTQKADLIEESEYPECFLSLSAHVCTYEAVLKEWEMGDYSHHTSVINFPTDELQAYAVSHYDHLKLQQAILLGHRQTNMPGKQKYNS